MEENKVVNPHSPFPEEELKTLCNNYAGYIQFPNLNKQQVNRSKETVEHMLTQVDELTALMDSIRMNTETTQTLIPSLMAHTKQLEKTFQLLDALDQFMNSLNQNLDSLEEKVARAEQSSSAISQAKRVLTSFPGMSRKSQSFQDDAGAAVETKSEEIEVIDTRQFFATLKVQLS